MQWAMDATWNFQRGTLFVVDNSAADDINELDVSGATAVLIDEFAHPDPAGGPEGITYDGQYLWTCSFSGNWIWKIDIGDPSPVAYFWDFETGWQGWTHTSASPFPTGWGVVSTSYMVSTYNVSPPDGLDSCMCIDSDAGYPCSDTAMSPAVVIPGTGFAWFKWAANYQNYAGYDSVEVLVRVHDGASWQPWTWVAGYGADLGPFWDSVDATGFTGDSLQVAFYYEDFGNSCWYFAFDNVELVTPPEHDVGCMAVVSPPEGAVAAATYDVTGSIRNYGGTDETFDVVGHVYDTTGMVLIFDQTVSLTLAAGADTDLVLGQVTFNSDSYYYTEIFTELVGDVDPSNDTASVYSWTALSLGDVVLELDIQTITGNNRLLGVEFDGANFYVTGGDGAGNNSIWVIDTFGTVVCQVAQPTTSSWGMRDLAWDGVYAGTDRIDTLYASDEAGLYKFGIDLTGSYTNYGTITGPVYPCRALAWDGDDEWFFTANWTPYHKFSKTTPLIQTQGTGPGSTYGAAYDTDPVDGGWIWWHSQVDPGTGYRLEIDQMEPATMNWTGLVFGFIPPSLAPSTTTNIAGGLCFHEGYRGWDVLFALVQGDPVDEICGIYVRDHVTGVAEEPGDPQALVFGFAPKMATVNKGHLPIAYTTTTPGHVSLKVYDGTGRLVQTLVNAHQPAGEKSLVWNNKDMHNRVVANGVYFFKLEAENLTAVHKMVLVK
jgi:hypothetical protein